MNEAETWYSVGRKCRCIADAKFIEATKKKFPWGNFPDSGEVYTIRGITRGTKDNDFLLLDGVHNEPRYSSVGVVEWGFNPDKFEPVEHDT